MPLNCKHIIVANYRVPEPMFEDYFDQLRTTFRANFHTALTHEILRGCPKSTS